MESVTLYPLGDPYFISSDLTVMPGVTLTLTPGVVLEFAPRVGLLILGTLIARGVRGAEIIMRPAAHSQNVVSNLPLIERYVDPLLKFFNKFVSKRKCL